MSDSVRTKKGTELPLMNLKGKKYLMVAYRIQWFTEEEPSFSIDTEFLVLDDEQTVCRATICTFDEKGELIRKATSTKRETKKDFPDHTEKAETGAIGRALIELGYGTQFALSDLDEGNRLADSPLSPVAKPVYTTAPVAPTAPMTVTNMPSPTVPTVLVTTTDTAKPEALSPLKRSSFNKNKKTETPAPKAISATIGEQPGETEWN